MSGGGIALLVIGVIIVLYIVLCVVLMCVASLRVRTKEPEIESVGRLQEHKDFISSGVRWLTDRNPETVEITSFDGLRLRALFLPAENARCTAILMHGYRSDYLWDFAGAYELLHEYGCNLLVPWERSHGQSEGKFICMGVKEKRDCASWAWYIEKRLGSELPIVLEGMSMGSATVLMAAGEKLPENVRGIVADCGFTSPWDQFAYIMKTRLHLPVHPLLDSISFFSKCIAGYGFRDYSTENALRTSKLPLLLIHGEADHFVPAEFSKRNFAASASEDKELILVPGAAHGMSYLVDMKRCREKILAFYDRVAGTYEKNKNIEKM